jgi:hypothetical protein
MLPAMKPADLHNLFIAIDRGFDCEMVLLEAELIRDGVNRDSIDALLEYRREQFAAWRQEHSLLRSGGHTLH